MAVLEQYSQRKLWTREEVARLNETFPEQRFELIEGELINKMGQKPPHAYLVTILNKILSEAFPGKVRVQLSISLPDPEGIRSEPEPDIVVLKRESTEFFHRHPGPQDIAVLIEVSDTSLQMDREIKARLYSRCGIAVYVIVDIPQRRVVVMQQPGSNEYSSVEIFEGDQTVTFIGPVNRLFEGV
jgi:Uma2 family endonuclease